MRNENYLNFLIQETTIIYIHIVYKTKNMLSPRKVNTLPLPCINYFISNSNYGINGILKLKNETSPRDQRTPQWRQKQL